MNIDFIPFKIGEQYENWEFDLEPVYDEIRYDRYKYYKNDIKQIYDIPIQNIYLSFNLDILFEIEYQLKAQYFIPLKTYLINALSSGVFKEFHNLLEWENTKICVIVEIPRKSETVILRVIDKNYYHSL